MWRRICDEYLPPHHQCTEHIGGFLLLLFAFLLLSLFCCCFHRVNHMQGLFKYSLETEDDDEPAPPPRLLGLHCATVAVQLLESMYNRYDDCFTPKSILRYTQCFAMYHDPLVADVVCFLFSISCLFLVCFFKIIAHFTHPFGRRNLC